MNLTLPRQDLYSKQPITPFANLNDAFFHAIHLRFCSGLDLNTSKDTIFHHTTK